MQQLKCGLQNYHWGRRGQESLVAQLAFKGGHINFIHADETYAELWMGVHPNKPSSILETNEALTDFISRRSGEFCGEQDLDFLLKVLSIHHPLSLQIHPDKDWAKLLHASNPQVYKTPKHKPELAIAYTPFTALCGFRPKKEINEFLEILNDIDNNVGKLFGLTAVTSEDDLQNMFANMMVMTQQQVTSLIHNLLSHDKTPLKVLMTHLHNYLPYDRGCLFIYLLNYIKLEPAEAIYLEPLTPHAYLTGNCIECMALSDNVIRAGLTFKFIDKEPLIESTKYKFSSEIDFKLEPQIVGKYKKIYSPPNDNEFTVCAIRLPQCASEKITSSSKAQILLVAEGEIKMSHLLNCRNFSAGAVILLSSNSDRSGSEADSLDTNSTASGGRHLPLLHLRR